MKILPVAAPQRCLLTGTTYLQPSWYGTLSRHKSATLALTRMTSESVVILFSLLCLHVEISTRANLQFVNFDAAWASQNVSFPREKNYQIHSIVKTGKIIIPLPAPISTKQVSSLSSSWSSIKDIKEEFWSKCFRAGAPKSGRFISSARTGCS